MTRFALLAALTALLLAPSAAAGGGWWSVIQVSRAPVAVGARVDLSASLYFTSDAKAEAAQQPGRYRVYLLRGFDDSGVERAMRKPSPGDWWSLGAAEAIEVGTVTVHESEANFGLASAAFTVPELAAGSYHVMLCDAGCTEPLAEVIPSGGFTVVADPATALLAKRVARLQRQNRKQTRELAAARDETYDAMAAAQDARSTAEHLQVRLAAVGRTSPPADRSAYVGWLVAGALAAALMTLVLRRTRSTRNARERAYRAAAP
jgi:hypothetical protein